MLFPESPTTGGGWKVERGEESFCEDENITRMEDLEYCMREHAYTINDTVVSCNQPFKRTFKVSTSGLVHMIQPANKTGNKPFNVNLNPQLNYFVGFTDPKYQLLSSNPSAVPYILRNIPFNSGMHIIYLKVREKIEFIIDDRSI